MAWKKIAEKNTIASNNGKEFDIDGKKIAVLTKKDIIHLKQNVCIKKI